jgi:hypothetical protein
MSTIDELLYRDFDGQPARDPSAVIFAGLEDGRHEARVAPLAAIMADAASAPHERLLAGIALASWGERTGYRMVVESARRPRAAPWYGCSVDRRYAVDDTFAEFALRHRHQ